MAINSFFDILFGPDADEAAQITPWFAKSNVSTR